MAKGVRHYIGAAGVWVSRMPKRFFNVTRWRENLSSGENRAAGGKWGTGERTHIRRRMQAIAGIMSWRPPHMAPLHAPACVRQYEKDTGAPRTRVGRLRGRAVGRGFLATTPHTA